MPNHAFQLGALEAPFRFAAAKSGSAPSAGLPNCTPFGPIIERELAACRRNGTSLVVLSIGLDGFESVGLRHGQVVEAQLLQAVWDRLRNHLRGSDLAVRVGNAEFGAVLRNAAGAAAALVDARLSHALSQPYGIGTLEIVLKAWAGVAIYPQAGGTGEALAAAAVQDLSAKR